MVKGIKTFLRHNATSEFYLAIFFFFFFFSIVFTIFLFTYRESGQTLLSTDEPPQPKSSPKPSPRASPGPKKGPQPSKLVDLGAASTYGSRKQQQQPSGGGGDLFGGFGQPEGNTSGEDILFLV